MNDNLQDYAFSLFFFLICVTFVMSIFVNIPERNDNEFFE